MKNKIIGIVVIVLLAVGISVFLRFYLPTDARPWWADRQAGWVGGIAGSLIGILTPTFVLMAQRNKCIKLAVGGLWAMTAVGAVSLVCGLVAVAAGQGYGVYYPLLLIGVLLCTIIPAQLWNLSRMRHAAELRRMQSLDV